MRWISKSWKIIVPAARLWDEYKVKAKNQLIYFSQKLVYEIFPTNQNFSRGVFDFVQILRKRLSGVEVDVADAAVVVNDVAAVVVVVVAAAVVVAVVVLLGIPADVVFKLE